MPLGVGDGEMSYQYIEIDCNEYNVGGVLDVTCSAKFN